MKNNDKEFKAIKIGLLGDTAIGKTAICYTFMGYEFTEEGNATIGSEKLDYRIKLDNGKEIKLVMWDTAGPERFRYVAFKVIREVQGIALVFDVTRKESFNNINSWLNQIKENFQDSLPTLILIGNKIDYKKNQWKVTQEEIDSLVKQKNLVYFATSAKTNEGINESFCYLANNIYNKLIIKKESKEKYPEVNQRKKFKDFKDELNYYRTEYDKLKKDYNKLNNELNKMKNINLNFENKVKDYLNEINNLKNNIIQKDDEILNLKLKLKNIESFNKTLFNNDDIIFVHFISSDQNINCPIKCLKTDTFTEVEERLYQKYQEYRETNNKFVSKGITVMRFKKIIENNINNGDKIELIKSE